jgi:hypothetical protein
MDKVSQWFPPLTNREVLIILGGCAIAIITGMLLVYVPFRRRLRRWATKLGYEVVDVQALSSSREMWDTKWRVTLRDQSGLTRMVVITYMGFFLFPGRIDAHWEGDPLNTPL